MDKRKKLLTIVLILTVSAGRLCAEKFEFRYTAGEKYRIQSVVDEEVYINGQYSHRADIINKISIEVPEAGDGWGRIKAKFITSERSFGSKQLYTWGRQYESEFKRYANGKYEIDSALFMPVVRDIPMFPDWELKPGATWSFPAGEVHDLRQNFGISEAFHFPIKAVSYEYAGKVERKGRQYDLIKVNYTVFAVNKKKYANVQFYPVRISGESEQLIYWNSQKGNPDYYLENFHIIFDLSSGDVVEYIGRAEAEVIEAAAMDKDKLVDEIKSLIKKENLKDMDVQKTGEGVSISLEKIQFLPDSDVLTDAEKLKLDRISTLLQKYSDRDIMIKGHTALAGTEEARNQLSLRRANAVASWLLSRRVLKESRIIIKGLGALEPAADNSTEEGRARNRRVEIIILEN